MEKQSIGLGLSVPGAGPETAPRHWWQAVPVYGACYGFYALVLALEFGVFVAWRWAMLGLIGAFIPESEWSSFVYMIVTALLGLGLFILAMAAEPYLHNGVRRHQLLRRFARLAIPLAIAGIVGMLLSTLVSVTML